jgi:peptide deformylase
MFSEDGEVLDIAQIGEEILVKRAAPIAEEMINAEVTQNLIRNMVATMYAAPGIGLAAPQVRQSLRIIVFYLPANRDDSAGIGVPLTILINPIIEVLDDSPVEDWEGCLSVKDKRGKVRRYRKIRYSGLDENGDKIDRIAEGWHARLVQHECDHLDGILYPEVMKAEDELLDVAVWRSLQQSSN